MTYRPSLAREERDERTAALIEDYRTRAIGPITFGAALGALGYNATEIDAMVRGVERVPATGDVAKLLDKKGL